MTVYLRRDERIGHITGPADLAAATAGDTIVLYHATAEDAARWASALWFALVRGASVEISPL